MTDSKRESIVERIKKLFAMANDKGASENEALQAALMAQRLMSENNVEEWELHAADEPNIVEVRTSDAPRKWRLVLAQVIAVNFRCKNYQQSRWRKVEECRTTTEFNERAKEIVFVGYETDAQAAALTFDYMYKVGNRLANRYADKVREERGWSDGAYNHFVLGFVEGARTELEKQSQALMLVVPAKVEEKYDQMSKGWKEADSRLQLEYSSENADAFREGEKEGREALQARRLGVDETSALSTEERVLPAAC